jgi:hypothetical protein
MSGGLSSSPANSVPAHVFRVWADYWVRHGQRGRIPPFHYYAGTLSGGVFLAVPLSPIEVKPFLEAEADNERFYFQGQGVTMLPEWSWFGHWSVFSVDIRATPLPIPIPMGIGFPK